MRRRPAQIPKPKTAMIAGPRHGGGRRLAGRPPRSRSPASPEMNEQFFLLLAALGFVAAGPSALWPARLPYAVGVHVWAVGSIGLMTLAMMTRATLGHTGRALVASRTTVFAYFCVVAALVAVSPWRCCPISRCRFCMSPLAPGFSPSPHFCSPVRLW